MIIILTKVGKQNVIIFLSTISKNVFRNLIIEMLLAAKHFQNLLIYILASEQKTKFKAKFLEKTSSIIYENLIV